VKKLREKGGYMSTFQDIKLVCSMFSNLNAHEVAKHLGLKFPDSFETETKSIINKITELEEILKNRGFEGVSGTTRSGAQDKEGNWIEFVALTQDISKKAPVFRDVLNEISRTFKIEMTDKQNIEVIGAYDEKSPDFIKVTSYFVSSEYTYAVNLNENKIMEIKGCQIGGANIEENGAFVNFNVEIVPDIETIVHELVHLKWPQEVPHIEESIDNVCKRITEELKKLRYDEFLNDPKIKTERKEILKDFELLNADFAYLINND
jgi:hypothetical protein